jgi:chromosome segregation and condensation protein ScpB
MKKILALAMTLLVPALIFLNAWQGYRYHVLSDEVSALQDSQKELVEKNMGVIAQIAYEQSPLRVEEKAIAQLHLSPVDQSHVTRVVVGSSGVATP